MAKSVRRVVTGHNADGKAVVISDAAASVIHERPSRPGVALTNLWVTDEAPPRFDAPPQAAGRDFIMFPAGSGTVFRISSFEPEDPEVIARLDGRAHFAEAGAVDAATGGSRHPFMHRTETLDYAIVLEGRITLLLDDSEVELAAGDVVVQRGTNHTWVNHGPETCRIAFILMGAEGERP